MHAASRPTSTSPAMARRGVRSVFAAFVLASLLSACASDSDGGQASSTTKAPGSAAPTSVEGSSNAAGVSGAAGRSGSVTPTKADPPSTYAVGSLTETYVDPTRPTSANGGGAGLPQRTLPTLILYPADGPPGVSTPVPGAEPVRRRWPLVVFSHGVTGSGPDYKNTLQVWASAGYVVLAPNYPLSSPRGVPGGTSIGDVAAQTRDVAFLIDQALVADKRPGTLEGMIDKNRIGLAGHSLGAITTLGAGYEACCFEPRVKAAAEFAGLFFPLEGSTDLSPKAAGRPLLIIHGMKDATVPYRSGPAVYVKAAPPKYFITLLAEGHVPAYVAGIGAPASKVVTVGTLDFFDRYLKGDGLGIDRMKSLVADAGPAVATIQDQAA